MQNFRRLALLTAVLAIAAVSTIALAGIFAHFDDPQFQRVLLRLLAVLGAVAVLAMCGSLLMRAETIDGLTRQTVPSRRSNRRH